MEKNGLKGIRHFIGGNGRRCLEKSSKIRCKLSIFWDLVKMNKILKKNKQIIKQMKINHLMVLF